MIKKNRKKVESNNEKKNENERKKKLKYLAI
jgi:hypothetical protein